MSLVKFRDDDTGESTLDVVEVPEGLSFQLGPVMGLDGSPPEYFSLTMGPRQEAILLDFLVRRLPNA